MDYYNNTAGSKYAVADHKKYVSRDERLNCSKGVQYNYINVSV